jgi:hypothetical protein
LSCCKHRSPVDQSLAAISQSGNAIPRYGLLELSFRLQGVYANPYFDIALDTVFTAPDGRQRAIKGFYYGGGVWKVRFRPDQEGSWTYAYKTTSDEGLRKEGTGEFQCTTSDADGPVRRNLENSHRWIFANGKPYFPIGIQDCIGTSGSKPTVDSIDGEGRGEGRQVSQEDYFSIYGKAGFNLFRFSQKNCSYPLYDDLDNYRETESLATDELLSLARDHGLRVMFGFFGNHLDAVPGSRPFRILSRIIEKVRGINTNPVWAPGNEIISKEKRFIDYAVARWGVYVDFWELLNERHASDEWITQIAQYVRTVDPDKKPISTSWEKPHLNSIDINAPHWYESESELHSDLRVVQQAAKWKDAGRPIIVGEHGNTGMNWDPLSATRMRIRTWTAVFQEVSFVFWNTSWSKRGMFYGRHTPEGWANIYLGPEERRYIRALQDFSSRLDASIRMAQIEVSSHEKVRAYGLRSDSVTAAYLHHFDNHNSAVHGVKITLDFPRHDGPMNELVGEWIEPSSGNLLRRVPILPGRQTLEVPPFAVDLALLVTSQHGRMH